MERSQFTFYESFARAVRRIKRPADRAKAYDAIVDYALYGKEPDMDALPDAVAIVLDLIRPTLDSSRRKAESGKAGGKKKQSESGEKPEAKPKQNESKPEAKQKQGESAREKEGEIEKEVEGEKENECYISPPSVVSPLPVETKEIFEVPTFEQVMTEAQARGITDLAKPFFDYYSAAGWRDSDGKPVRSWRQKLVAWKVREDDKLRKGTGRKYSPGAGDTAPHPDGKADQRAREDMERLRKKLAEMKEQEAKEAEEKKT